MGSKILWRCSLSSTSLRWGDSERGRKEEWARYSDVQEKEGKEEMNREWEAGRKEKKEGKKGRRKEEGLKPLRKENKFI